MSPSSSSWSARSDASRTKKKSPSRLVETGFSSRQRQKLALASGPLMLRKSICSAHQKKPRHDGRGFCSIFEPHTFVVATQRAGGVFSSLLAPKISLAAAGGPMALGATGYRGFATCRELATRAS
jgi:hypothetical protein